MRSRFRVDFLRCLQSASKVNRLPSSFCDHVLKRGQHSNRIQIIVIAEVGDAEKLSFQLCISIGHDCAKFLSEEFANRCGVGSRGSRDCSECCCSATWSK